MEDDSVGFGSVSNDCSNPGCMYVREQYDGIEKKVEHELWRAGQAIARARALRTCANFVLYTTAVYHIVFADSVWPRVGAVIMIGLCIRAMHSEG